LAEGHVFDGRHRCGRDQRHPPWGQQDEHPEPRARTSATQIRSDVSGAQPSTSTTLGPGAQLNQLEGTVPETGASILVRIANDLSGANCNSAQPEGKYYFAGDATQPSAAFQQIRDQIIGQ
jgi:hypothetical protein